MQAEFAPFASSGVKAPPSAMVPATKTPKRITPLTLRKGVGGPVSLAGVAVIVSLLLPTLPGECGSPASYMCEKANCAVPERLEVARAPGEPRHEYVIIRNHVHVVTGYGDIGGVRDGILRNNVNAAAFSGADSVVAVDVRREFARIELVPVAVDVEACIIVCVGAVSVDVRAQVVKVAVRVAVES